MRWRSHLVTAPTWEPLLPDVVKDQRRIDGSDQDADLDRLAVKAREWAEGNLSLAIPRQTRALYLNGWPRSRVIHLPRPPLVSVSSITYRDTNGDTQTLAADQYAVYAANAVPGKDDHGSVGYIVPAYNVSWPSLYPMPENVIVTYVCGWASRGPIPEDILQGMLLHIGQQDENREPDVTGTIVATVNAIEALFCNHRCYFEFGPDCGGGA